ncbi:EAL domain-containing protein [bacterium]|nr:EAL domain-containing protein [bacterium]
MALVFVGWGAALLRGAQREKAQVAEGALLASRLDSVQSSVRNLNRALRPASGLNSSNIDETWDRAHGEYAAAVESLASDSSFFPAISETVGEMNDHVVAMSDLYPEAAAFRLGDASERESEENFLLESALALDRVNDATSEVRHQMGLLSVSLDRRWSRLRTIVIVSCLLALCLGIMLLIHQRDLDRRMRVEHDLRSALDFSEEIERLGHAINGNTEIEKILDHVCQAVLRHCGIPHASIIYRSPSTHQLTESVTTVPEQQAAGVTVHKEVRSEGGRTQHILKNRERIVMEDIANDPFEQTDHLSNRFGMRSYVGMPVEAGGEVLGVMYAMSREPRSYDSRVLRRLEQLATQAGAALSNAHLFWEAKQQNLNLEETVRQRTQDLEQANVDLRNEITERTRTEQELESSLSILRGTLESTADGIMVADKNGDVVTFNRKFLDMWQLPRDLVEEGGHLKGMEIAKDRLADPEGFIKRVQELYENPEKEAWDTLTFADGRIIERYSLPQRSGGQIVGRVWSFRDITQRRRAEERLAFLAYHDALTELPNKAAFVERLEKAVRSVRAGEEADFAVLFLDLDRFKLINDAMGHITGDKYLIAVSRRLERCVRPGIDIVARFGGDEYTFFLDGVRDSIQAGQRADEVLEILSEPLDLEGHEVYPTACIGIALATMGHNTAEDILRDADTAMYRAKALGKNRYAIFDRQMHDHLLQMLAVETELRRAISGGELRTHYQPIVDLEERRVAGFEALVRWEHPERGVIAPTDFIPMAEESGLVIEIGEWMLSQASRHLAHWHSGRNGKPLPYVTVNISGIHFMQRDLLDVIERSLEESRIPPNFLRIELTESVFMESAEWTSDMIGRLKAMDLKILIDDFGTGYSSLNYLYRFPIDALKIDRSFVSSLGRDNDAYEIVLAIATLARALGMDVIAEGVETPEQMNIIRELGIRYVQGFLISRAVPMDEAEALLDNLPALY